MEFADLTDSELTAEVSRLVSIERQATAALLASLSEFDSRRLYLAAGFSSLFAYCKYKLHLGEGAAYRRIASARAARRFPCILELIAHGDLQLTTVSLLAPHLTADNHESLLAEASRQETREVERMVARLQPKPDVPTVIRKLPERAAAVPAVNGAATPPSLIAAAGSRSETVAAAAAASPPRREVVAPLTAERFKFQVTIDRETHDTLREIQDLIRHAVPNGDPALIVARALRLLREHLLRQKAARVRRPRVVKPVLDAADASTAATGEEWDDLPPASRGIAAAVKRAVWERDAGRCAFEGSDGRCRERTLLEFHHVKPFAAAGDATVDNLQLRCRAHNAFEAEVYFGHPHERRRA